MASQYGDLTIFNAREGGDPTQEREAARAEGSKRAAYLSSMDQYYAQLDFLKEVETGKREMFTEELAFKGKELAAQEKQWGEQNTLAREQIGAQEKQWQAELAELRSWHSQTVGLEEKKLAQDQSQFDKKFGLEKVKLQISTKYDDPMYQSYAKRYGDLMGQSDYLSGKTGTWETGVENNYQLQNLWRNL